MTRVERIRLYIDKHCKHCKVNNCNDCIMPHLKQSSRAEELRNNIVVYCNRQCCMGFCEICILNTIKEFLDKRG